MANNRLAIRRNIKLISWFNLFIEMRFINVVSILFYSQVTGSYALGMSVITAELWASSLFELPTGILSDKIGRKKTMVLGAFCDVIAIFILGCAGLYSSYILLLMGSILCGFAMSLYSGTEEALLYETIVELRKGNKYHEILGRFNSLYRISGSIAALLGAFLAYKYSYTFVVFLTLIPLLICFIISLFFVEPKINKEKETNKEINNVNFMTAVKLFKSNKRLGLLALANVIKDSSDNTFHCFEATFFEILIPVWAIGIVRSIKHVVGATSFWFAGKIINKIGYLKSLLFSITGNCVATMSALLLNSAISPFIMALINSFYGLGSTAKDSLIQKEFSDKQRATMGSIVAFFRNILFGILSVATGYVADSFGIVTALYVLLLINVSTVFIYRVVLK